MSTRVPVAASPPATSGLFHVSSSYPSTSSGSALLNTSPEKKTEFDVVDVAGHTTTRTVKTFRSKSFIQKPVVLFTSLEKKVPEDRSSSGSNSSSTSTTSSASTGSHQESGSEKRQDMDSVETAPVLPPPRKSIRKSASSIVANSTPSSSTRTSLSKSNSTTTRHSGSSGGTVLAMPSPSRSSSSLLSTSQRSSASPLSQHEELAGLQELPLERKAAYTEFIDKSIDDAYNLCHGFGRIRWHSFKTREGVSICRARGEDDHRLDAAVRGKCNVNATFHEMMDALITETTEEFINHENAVNPTEFLDGQVLHTIVPRTPEDRFVCIKWHCIKSLAPSVAKHRDYVYVEVVDQFENEDGKKVGYRLAKSIDVEEMAAMDTSHLFVRGKTLTLQTFSEVSQGNLELYTMMINDLGERLPTWLVHKIVDTAAMRVACIRDHINQRRIDLLVFANPKDLVPLNKRVCCIVCTKSFSLVRKKYNCVACGDVICNQCSVHQLVSSQGISEFVGKRKARICVKCSSGITTKELPRRSTLRHSDLASEASTRSSTPTRYSGERKTLAELESRNYRSMSSLESSGSTVSNEDGSVRVHPAGNRPTIPHMFQQFRPSSASIKADQSSTTTPSSAPSPDEESEDDDDMEHELFDANVNTTAISPQELDLGVGRYKEEYVQQAQSELAVESFLMDEEPQIASFLTQDDVAAQAPVATTMEELIVEEVMPGNRSSSFSSQPRRSILQMHDESDADMVQPVIVRKVEKLSIGAGGRRSRDIRPRDLPPRPEEVVVETADFTGPIETVEEPAEDVIQLSDLQVHLDRMTQISQSLRNLNVNEIESSTEATVAMRRLANFEKKANAEAAAAMIAANFLSRLDRPTSSPVFTFAQMTGPPRFNLALAMGDGSITDFLIDSIFAELTEPVEGILDGWQTVHSQTTGKMYYYNETCGLTTWTLPVPEMQKGAVYMVL